jgi:hypothetical protein
MAGNKSPSGDVKLFAKFAKVCAVPIGTLPVLPNGITPFLMVKGVRKFMQEHIPKQSKGLQNTGRHANCFFFAEIHSTSAAFLPDVIRKFNLNLNLVLLQGEADILFDFLRGEHGKRVAFT